MKHLKPEEFIDAVDKVLSPERQAHLDSCTTCAAEVRQLARLIAHTRGHEVPEPSPLFWDRASDRVRAAIAAERDRPPPRPWFAWPVLAPVAALVLVVVALGAAVSRDRAVLQRPSQTAAAPDENESNQAAIEAVWTLAMDLVGDADVSEADDTLLVMPGSAELAAVHLSSDEQAELVKLLQQELGRSGG